MRKAILFLFLVGYGVLAQASGVNKAGGIHWVDWTDDLFQQAQKQKSQDTIDWR